ncbi:hypothetical protein J4408_01765 [Candidatus Pacearchaeota archaeon]|nr:hypothetical protein [Candidatus Pacearchaeota archaeon]
MMKKRDKTERGIKAKKTIAFGEVFLLICLTFAVAFLLGQEIRVVGATTYTLGEDNYNFFENKYVNYITNEKGEASKYYIANDNGRQVVMIDSWAIDEEVGTVQNGVINWNDGVAGQALFDGAIVSGNQITIREETAASLPSEDSVAPARVVVPATLPVQTPVISTVVKTGNDGPEANPGGAGKILATFNGFLFSNELFKPEEKSLTIEAPPLTLGGGTNTGSSLAEKVEKKAAETVGATALSQQSIVLADGKRIDANVLDNIKVNGQTGTYAIGKEGVYFKDSVGGTFSAASGADMNKVLTSAGFTQSQSTFATGKDLIKGEEFWVSGDSKKLIAVNKGELSSYERGSATDSWTAAAGGAATGTYTGKLGIGPFGFDVKGNIMGRLATGISWAGAITAGLQVFGPLLGLDKNLQNSLNLAAVGGIMTYQGVKGLIASGKIGGNGLSGKFLGPLTGKQFAAVAGIGVAAAIFIFTYKKESKKMVRFECLPWEAPTGGSKCEECNKDPFRPCSEYRCKSLGQACEIVNPGTEEEKCVWINPKDVTSPTIQPWVEALKPQGLIYTPDNAIRPPNRGVKIVKQGAKEECLQAFTPLEFGITTNEPAQCKLDWDRNKTFETMEFFFGESNFFRQNHTQTMALPGPEEISGSPLIQNDGTFSLFVRCQDANGNFNVDAFVFNFCVDEGPDTTPPIMQATSIENGGAVQYNADKVPIELFVNEPADCKWSRQNKAFEDMENIMSCNTETFQINADLTYSCKGDLTGIENRAENKFYFRCKDQPGKEENERNVNVQSKELTLRGTEPLTILEVGPNGTLFGSTDVVPITLTAKTDDGANEGEAICYFSASGGQDTFVAMFETNSFEHKQELDLVAGTYNYHFRCIDAGGNAAESQTGFTIKVDKEAPRITRVYKDTSENALKVVTDEKAECTYSLNTCNFVFEEGIQMIYSNPSVNNVLFAEWKATNVYYIKCKDEFGNQPSPNTCNLIVSAVELSQQNQ